MAFLWPVGLTVLLALGIAEKKTQYYNKKSKREFG